MAINIKFNDISIPSFIHVTNIKTQILSKINNNRKERVISIEFFIRKNGLLNIDYENIFISWLRGNSNEEFSKLILPNKSELYYLAKVNNYVDLSGSFRKGTGTIEFLCVGNKVSEELNTVNINDNSIVMYEGSAEIKPLILVDVTSQVNEIKLSVNNSRYNNFINLAGNFNQGSKILIDMNTNKVTVNDVVNLPILTLDSNFHNLVSGQNTYRNHNISKYNITLKYRNEFE